MVVYTLGQVTAMAFAPLISAAIMGKLSGVGGLPGWKWLFLIEGAPSILLGLAMFAWLPSSPLSFSALSEGDREMLHEKVGRRRSIQHEIFQTSADPTD